MRDARSELENHYIDELVAGRLSRRQFMRKGAVIGMSTGLMGAILAACGGANSNVAAAAPRRPPRPHPQRRRRPRAARSSWRSRPRPGAINPLTVADAGGLCMLAQTGEFLDLRQQPGAAARADAGDQLEAERRRHGVDVQAAPGRQVPQRPADDGRRRRLHVPAAVRPQERLQRAVDVRRRAQARRRAKVDAATVAFHLEAPTATSRTWSPRTTTTRSSSPREPTTPSGRGRSSAPARSSSRATPRTSAPRSSPTPTTGAAPRTGRTVQFYASQQPQILALQGGEVDVIGQFVPRAPVAAQQLRSTRSSSSSRPTTASCRCATTWRRSPIRGCARRWR